MTQTSPPSMPQITPLPESALPPCRADDEPSPRRIESLLQFNRNYQLRELSYFAALRLQWRLEHPGRTFPGLCAEVDSISGRWRPLAEQRAWSWGDARALGIWCYFLQKGFIPDAEQTVEFCDGSRVTFRLAEQIGDYCEHLYRVLDERQREHDGKLPFMVDIATNRAADDPRHLRTAPHEWTAADIFAANAFCQYGLWRDDPRAIEQGLSLLDETMRAAIENRIVSHMTGRAGYTHGHGSMMIATGAAVDTLKTVDLLASRGRPCDPVIRQRLVTVGRWAMDQFCGYHWSQAQQRFSEYLDPIRKTFWTNEQGRIICDPGHTAEGVGFFAELSAYLPEDDRSPFRFHRGNVTPTLVRIFDFVVRHGHTPDGLLYKHLDLVTLRGAADAQLDGRPVRTAPWWNLREYAAAAIRLYALTGEPALWRAYLHALEVGYRRYANGRIGGLMVQTLDADTARPVPLHPATGNLDPMHSARSREREIEALETLRADTR